MTEDKNSHSIQDMPATERPRERLEIKGEGALSTQELLAIILRVGVEGMSAVDLGNFLLKEFNGLAGLHSASFDQLCAVKGLGPAKTAQLKAALEIGDRLRKEEEKDAPVFSSPEAVDEYMHHRLNGIKQEEMWILALNTRNKLVREKMLYRGTINHSSARMAEIMEVPIMARSAGLIVVHNHPSGVAKASPEDIRFTEELVKAGVLMDVAVLDHIIIGREGFCSIRREGRVKFTASTGRSWH